MHSFSVFTALEYKQKDLRKIAKSSCVQREFWRVFEARFH